MNDLLSKFINDTQNPEYNFYLAEWYESHGYTAAGLTFYLRAAERFQNKLLAYNSLLKGFQCYDKQGSRDDSAKVLLQNAIALYPSRPEAYYLLCSYYAKYKQWQDCYVYSSIAIELANSSDLEPLISNVEYPGMYAIMLQKAISGQQWGKNDEAKDILKELLQNITIPKNYYEKIMHELKNLDDKFHNIIYPPELDSNIINTIYREIYVDNVYEKFMSINENDVVVDIGSNVGMFGCSILDKKPKTLYCLEPSSLLLKASKKNLHKYNISTKIILDNIAIGDTQNDVDCFEKESIYDIVSFKNFIIKYDIKYIDFLKIDCEGGEYSIFNNDNINYLKNNVKYIAMECHIKNDTKKQEKFKIFRDHYLQQFSDVKIISCKYQPINIGNNVDLSKLIYDDSFIEKYEYEFMIYINNSKNHFHINHQQTPTALIIDNFYKDPDAVRQFALSQKFMDGGYGKGYIGKRTYEQFLFDGLKEKFEDILGQKINSWEDQPMNGRFQITYAGEPLVYHCDSQKWAAMIYLTPNAPFECGTSLYAHKITKARSYNDPGWDYSWKDTHLGDLHLDGTFFEPVDILGNVYNRLVIFDGSNIHSASKYFGQIDSNARLWHMFFFD